MFESGRKQNKNRLYKQNKHEILQIFNNMSKNFSNKANKKQMPNH